MQESLGPIPSASFETDALEFLARTQGGIKVKRLFSRLKWLRRQMMKAFFVPTCDRAAR